MEGMTMTAELKNAIQAWPSIKGIFFVPHTLKDYKKLIKILDEIIDEVGENENHPLAPLLETIGSLAQSYEEKALPELKGNPVSVLKYLMAEHDVGQNNLREIGSQGVVSEILSGKRSLNLRQIKALATRFHVSPAAFI
jgi:HTH-type transcriptional regulator / antitoxin HigA